MKKIFIVEIIETEFPEHLRSPNRSLGTRNKEWILIGLKLGHALAENTGREITANDWNRL